MMPALEIGRGTGRDHRAPIAVQAFLMTVFLFLILPYVHLVVRPEPPLMDRLDVPRLRMEIRPPPVVPPPPMPPPAPAPPHPAYALPALAPARPSVVPAPMLDVDLAPAIMPGDLSLSSLFQYAPAIHSTIFEIADVDQAPRAVAQMQPHYPAYARRRRIEGSVTVVFTVNPQGTTESIQMIESIPDGVFADSARRAVERWRFIPAFKQGTAVSVRVRQVIRFRMEDEPVEQIR